VLKAKKIIEIDGSLGEGGGQVLRSALSLSMLTQQGIVVQNIRGGRPKPGLMRQHLTAVKAALEVCEGEAQFAEMGSSKLEFYPGAIRGGDFEFHIGSAGSTTLVFQTLLPALLALSQPSRLKISGGTHNSGAPTADFIGQAFLPALAGLGLEVNMELERYGFMPAGGGRLNFEIQGQKFAESRVNPQGLFLEKPIVGEADSFQPEVFQIIAEHLPEDVFERERETLCASWGVKPTVVERIHAEASCPVNLLQGGLRTQAGIQWWTTLSHKGLSSEAAAQDLTAQMQRFIRSKAQVETRLADQLLLPMVLTSGGEFSTDRASRHLRTQAALIEQFLGPCIQIIPHAGLVRVQVKGLGILKH
jgi:RNA 3'-terminal phosphate cyclase (ATP)